MKKPDSFFFSLSSHYITLKKNKTNWRYCSLYNDYKKKRESREKKKEIIREMSANIENDRSSNSWFLSLSLSLSRVHCVNVFFSCYPLESNRPYEYYYQERMWTISKRNGKELSWMKMLPRLMCWIKNKEKWNHEYYYCSYIFSAFTFFSLPLLFVRKFYVNEKKKETSHHFLAL